MTNDPRVHSVFLTLANIRLDKGLRQADVAAATKIAPQTISRRECGKGAPTLTDIYTFADALGRDLQVRLARKELSNPGDRGRAIGPGTWRWGEPGVVKAVSPADGVVALEDGGWEFRPCNLGRVASVAPSARFCRARGWRRGCPGRLGNLARV